MEPPSIPRMPPVQYRMLWAAGGVNVLRLILVAVFGPLVDWLTMGGLAAVYAYIVVRFLRHRWQIRRALRILRRLPAVNRTAVLDGLDDEHAKAYFEYRLAEHGEPQSIGVVERFGFSPVDRREFAILTLVTAIAAVLVLVAPVSMGLDGVWRITAYGCALALAFAVWILLRGSDQLSRTFEVSPFGLSEVLPDASVRRLLWGYGIVLRNRPWLRRIELAPPDHPDSINIPYSVVGFDRLVEEILNKGGFQHDEAA
jgi:hypothetical protein